MAHSSFSGSTWVFPRSRRKDWRYEIDYTRGLHFLVYTSTEMNSVALALLALRSSAPSAQAHPRSRPAAQGTSANTSSPFAPNDSVAPADIQRTSMGSRRVPERGFTTKHWRTRAKPMLYAEWPRKVSSAKTVLFYMHRSDENMRWALREGVRTRLVA